MNERELATWEAAREVLDDARQWNHHDATGWATVDKHLDQLETAAANTNAEAALPAVAGLELIGPCRCHEHRKPDATEIPAETLDFLNHVDALIKEVLDEQK